MESVVIHERSSPTCHHKQVGILGGALIVAGTSIGGGMLALPVLTSPAGLIPSLTTLVLCWLFMTATGLLFLELCLWTQKQSNFITLARITLGTPGAFLNWVIYLLFFYCLLVAYFVGGTQIIASATQWTHYPYAASCLFLALCSPILLLSKNKVNFINKLLMGGLILTFGGFMCIGIPHFDWGKAYYSHWEFALVPLPVAFTAFGYQGTLPTLASWMQYNARRIRYAIILGTSFTLIIYILWETLILGIIPLDGPQGLMQAYHEGSNAIIPLKNALTNPYVLLLGQSFGFLALMTSLLGISLGIIDFWADGFKIDPKGWRRAWLAALTLLPPFCISLIYPGIFLKALDYAGGIGSALLLGLMPILMVAMGRYRYRFPANDQIPGQQWALWGLGAFVTIEIGVEMLKLFLSIASD